jgi:hypothetical protein
MFKMDMIWKKRNKTGGLQSRHRPMRNHEMVYFFYEQAPQYNRDKYHKRIQPKKEHNIEKEDLTMGTTHKMKDTMHKCFDPPNPASVVEEKPLYKTSKYTENVKKGFGYETGPGIQKDKKGDARFPLTFDPPNPASIVEETEDVWGQSKFSCGGDCGRLNEDGSYKLGYEPPNPASVYESTKVFIGKRHHQTEKPQDILEFFIKYWSDEGHTILDPTMGSGSTGVACKTLKRNFIGYEKDEKIFKVAENRIKKVEVII